MESLLFLVEDYQRLWAVTGFAERFALRLARPGAAGEPLGVTRIKRCWASITTGWWRCCKLVTWPATAGRTSWPTR